MQSIHIHHLGVYLNVLSTGKLSPDIVDPIHLGKELTDMQKQLTPTLMLPDDPTTNIWHFHKYLTVTAIVYQDRLMVLIKIPLIDTDSEMTLYKVYNLPVYHAKLEKSLQSNLEGNYLALTRDRNYATIPSEAESVNQVSYMPEYRLSEIDLTGTAAQQLSDKHCIRIRNLMKYKSSKFPERDRYQEEKNILYHTDIENGKEYKAVVVPKHLMPTVLKEMHDKFGHFGIGKTYSLIKRYYFWPKMIKHIQKHVENCSLCRHEKLVADKYQLQTTEIPDRPFAKVSVDLIVELPRTDQGTKNIVVMVDDLPC